MLHHCRGCAEGADLRWIANRGVASTCALLYAKFLLDLLDPSGEAGVGKLRLIRGIDDEADELITALGE